MNTLPAMLIWLAGLLLLLLSGMPVIFALGVTAVASLYIGLDARMAGAIGMVTWTGQADFVMAAMPLFIFMSYVITESGMSSTMYSGIEPLLDRLLPGGLLHTNIAFGAVFAACSGSSIAASSTIGKISLPEMEKRGYERNIAAGSIAAGGTLGILIPPSIMMVLYGLLTNESIGRLFIGGIIPGLILTGGYMTYIGIRVKLQPHLVSSEQNLKTKHSWRFSLLSMLKVWPAIIFVIGVMGSLYTGFATPTEAAAVGTVIALILTAFQRLLSWQALRRAVSGALVTSCMVLALVFAGKLMSIYLSNSGITRDVAAYVVGLNLSPALLISLVIMLYLFLGAIMDTMTMMVLTLPLIFPIVMAAGFDAIWFGIIMTMLSEAGMMTPPFGMNLFILQGYRPQHPFMELVKGCFWFFLVILGVIILLTFLPNLVTFLPERMIGR